uniref:Gnk2-homologous domain-containing protein n=1 Tax=Angiostrongylus cantonensis TaxID=6313 RepID=A0A0K0DIT9_ANGCA
MCSTKTSLPTLVSGEVIEKNCSLNTDGRTMACYTCMGRDMANCLNGITCCKGSCFKLIDAEHNMIVKGCTNDDEEDASMKVRTLNVGLYWVYQEKVKGESC